mgnify:CR=1 FL=1
MIVEQIRGGGGGLKSFDKVLGRQSTRPTAARMLALLGVRAIRLMTNNPAKVAALEAEGVTVAERVPHALPDNPHNARYLATKRDRSGHLL